MRQRADGSGMSLKTSLIIVAGAALAGIVLLFDVDWAPEFALPRDVVADDPAQEARYAACFAARDAGIHARAFATIDNPDVQKEFIAMQRDAAQSACRERFPRQTVTRRQPFVLRLVELDYRYD